MLHSSRPGSAAPVVPQLLAEHLRTDAAAREATVTRFISRVACVFTVSTLGLGPLIGWPRSFSVAVLCALFALYYGVLHRRLRQGWFHPTLLWVNVALEASTGAYLFICDPLFANAEQALANPMAVLWSTCILLAALRSNRSLALPIPLMFTPPLVVLRAAY